MGMFELSKAAGGKFKFNLKAANGRVVLTSQTYATKAAAKNGIESVKKNGRQDARFERKKAKNGKPYFVLTSTNDQVIGKSQMYAGSSGMSNGIASVKKAVVKATIKDLT
jgi:uncharacterized protein YegP (UPF0339 family)